jgi:hypothetical protein
MPTVAISDYTIQKICGSIVIYCHSLDLGKSAKFRVDFLDKDTQAVIKSEIVFIEGEEYENWVEDSYVVDLICAKFGLTQME